MVHVRRIMRCTKAFLLVACGLLLSITAATATAATQVQEQSSLLTAYAAKIQPLQNSGTNVTGTIVVAVTAPSPAEGNDGRWVLFYGGFLNGLQPNVDAHKECKGARKCTVLLHQGTCDKIRGRAYNCGQLRDADQDAWRDAKYSTNEHGFGRVQSFFTIPNFGFRDEGAVEGHVLVVRSAEDKTKIACGEVKALSAFANDMDPIVRSEEESLVATGRSRDGDGPTNTSVVFLDTNQAQQRCTIGYAEGSVALVEDFLTTSTHATCNANNSHIETWIMPGSTANGRGKAWFGSCKATDTDTVSVIAAATEAESSPSSGGYGSNRRPEDVDQDVSCGFQEGYDPPPLPEEDPELELEEESTPVGLQAENTSLPEASTPSGVVPRWSTVVSGLATVTSLLTLWVC